MRDRWEHHGAQAEIEGQGENGGRLKARKGEDEIF